MRLSSIDIRKQEFKRVLRGCDSVEVEAFLEMVADEYEMVQKANAEWKEKAGKLEERIRQFEGVESNLKKTLTEAQHSADASKVSSRKEADIVIKEAEFKADRLADESRREIARLKGEIIMLQSHKKQLAGRLKQLLNSQIELIKILEMEEPDAEAARKPEEMPRTTPAYTPLSTRDAAAGARRPEPPRPREKQSPPPEAESAQKSVMHGAQKPPEIREIPAREDKGKGEGETKSGEQSVERKKPEHIQPPHQAVKKETRLDTDELIDRMILEHERREEESRKTGKKGEPGAE